MSALSEDQQARVVELVAQSIEEIADELDNDFGSEAGYWLHPYAATRIARYLFDEGLIYTPSLTQERGYDAECGLSFLDLNELIDHEDACSACRSS